MTEQDIKMINDTCKQYAERNNIKVELLKQRKQHETFTAGVSYRTREITIPGAIETREQGSPRYSIKKGRNR